jgi:MFS family permease
VARSLISEVFGETTHSETLRAVLISVVGVGFAIGFIDPLISELLDQKGFDEEYIGFSSGMQRAGFILVSLIIPLVIHKMGARPLFLTGILLLSASFLAVPFVETQLWLLPLRVLLGSATGILFIMGGATVCQLSHRTHKGIMLGFYAAATAGGVTLGPTLIEVLPTKGAFPFVFASLFMLFMAIPLIWAKRLTQNFEDDPVKFNGVVLLLALPTIAVASLVAGMAEAVNENLLAVYGEQLGLSIPGAALLVTVCLMGGIVLSGPIGWLGDKIGYLKGLCVCSLFIILTFATILIERESLFISWPLLFFAGGAILGMFPLTLAVLGHHFSGANLAGATAGYFFMNGVGGMLGPIVCGFMMTRLGDSGFPWFMLVTLVVFVLTAYFFAEKKLKL